MSSRLVGLCLPASLALACVPSPSDVESSKLDASAEAEPSALTTTEEDDGPVSPIWGPLADLSHARSHHAAALVTAFTDEVVIPHEERESPLGHEGRVLVAGGFGEHAEALASSEIYDPETGAWTAAARLRTPRGAAASEAYFNRDVEDFRTFLSGGLGAEGQVLSSVERYSAESATWQLYGAMQSPRVGHTMDLIALPFIPLTELLLIAGGSDGDDILASSEVMVGGEDAEFSAMLTDARQYHASAMMSGFGGPTASDLAGAAVVVSGGQGEDELLASAEIFEFYVGASGEIELLDAGSWFHFGDLREPRKHHTMTAVGLGLLVAGGIGEDGELLATAEVFGEGWSSTGEMSFARAHHTATLLPDGRVLVVGGSSDENAQPEIWDPSTEQWSLIEDAPCSGDARTAHSATRLADGSVVVAGGEVGEPDALVRLASVERYDVEGGILAQGIRAAPIVSAKAATVSTASAATSPARVPANPAISRAAKVHAPFATPAPRACPPARAIYSATARPASAPRLARRLRIASAIWSARAAFASTPPSA